MVPTWKRAFPEQQILIFPSLVTFLTKQVNFVILTLWKHNNRNKGWPNLIEQNLTLGPVNLMIHKIFKTYGFGTKAL